MAPHQVVGLVHDENGVFGISFPDFPGCISTGDDLDDVVARGQVALAFHVAGMAEDGDPLPSLRSLTQLRRDAEFAEASAGALVVAVPLDLPGRAVRVNISLDGTLLEQVDRAAARANQTRSAFLAEAARARIGRA